jgi:hypothetical protein
MRINTTSIAQMAVLLATICIANNAIAQSSRPSAAEMAKLGSEHNSAFELYDALSKRADGGQQLTMNDLPPWSEIYTRGRGAMNFDPDKPEEMLTSAKLTKEYQARFEETLRLRDLGIEYDPLSTCRPPGYPRWFTEPYLREFVVYPDQTWLMNEMVNDVRRIYTDGRGHTPPEDRYPLYNGDSIGFWDDHKLVIHTNQLMSGQYQRAHPDHSDQIETVEIWQQIDDRNIEVDVWVYDPPALTEPWHTRQLYTKLTDPEKRLRIRYWNCNENQNNATYTTEEGATQFSDFTFTTEDDNEE